MQLRIKIVYPYQRLRNRHEPLNVQFVLAEIEDLECPIPFQDLRDISNAALWKGISTRIWTDTSRVTHPNVITFEIQSPQSA